MNKEQTAAQIRQRLDKQLAKWPKGITRQVPPNGWISTLRMALGMTTRQLAKRLDISQSAIISLEQSEIKGSIQLDTLQRVARKMNCKLVYALVPNEPLDVMLAAQLLARAGHAMKIKPRHLESAIYREVLDTCAKEIPLRQVWDEID